MDEAFIGMFAIFCIFIALPWMVLHFLSKHRANAVKAAGDPQMNASLITLADKIEKRLDAMESLLDHEVPGWRKSPDRRNS
ncbi:MAG TPA: envelope stress response membrane protein PspB [Verrucomicrobiae bacterium]|nr:envelope stress response membrane protein PspB [Verrucomicrobiae bacterium]